MLVTRGDRQVVHTVASNGGARFSDAGFRMLVKRSASDEALAMQVGSRRDLPRQHFLRLLDQASATVRARLAAENPNAGAAVEGVLSEVVVGIRSETRKVSSEYRRAPVRGRGARQVRPPRRGRCLSLRTRPAVRADNRRAVDAGGVEIDIAERALLDPATRWR